MYQRLCRLCCAAFFPALLIQLVACGGSPGASGTPPREAPGASAPPPVSEVWVQVDGIKALRLEWVPAAGAETQFLQIEWPGVDEAAWPLIEVAPGTGSHRLEVFVPVATSARFRIRSCNLTGCSESPWATVPDLASAVGYVKAGQALSGDWFGHAVALSGDGSRLAVASWLDDGTVGGIDPTQVPSPGFDAGAIEVYRHEGGSWQREAVIKAPTPGWGDRFGTDLALSDDGQVLITGVPNEDGSGSGVGSNPSVRGAWDSGAAQVYERGADGQWRHVAYLKADVATAYRQFGQHVALSGDGLWAAVSERGNSAMRAHLFKRTGSGWAAAASLPSVGNRIDDLGGRRLALDRLGRTLVFGVGTDTAGGPGVNPVPDGEVDGAGTVFVFERNAQDVWGLSTRIRADVLHHGMNFGWSTALSADGSRLVVGTSATVYSSYEGGAFVFDRSVAGWQATDTLQPLTRSGARGFGFAVAISHDGQTVAVSDVDESGPGLGSDFTASAGAGGGAVSVFLRSPAGGWTAQPAISASNEQPGLLFGWSLSLAGDGQSLAVGAPGDPSGASGVGGDPFGQAAQRSGAVHLY